MFCVFAAAEHHHDIDSLIQDPLNIAWVTHPWKYEWKKSSPVIWYYRFGDANDWPFAVRKSVVFFFMFFFVQILLQSVLNTTIVNPG